MMPAVRTTIGVGSIAVWPVRIRNDATDVTTAPSTTTKPTSARHAPALVRPRIRRLGLGSLAAATSCYGGESP